MIWYDMVWRYHIMISYHNIRSCYHSVMSCHPSIIPSPHRGSSYHNLQRYYRSLYHHLQEHNYLNTCGRSAPLPVRPLWKRMQAGSSPTRRQPVNNQGNDGTCLCMSDGVSQFEEKKFWDRLRMSHKFLEIPREHQKLQEILRSSKKFNAN